MSIRGYGMACTGVLGSIFGFDLIWNMTQMDAIEAAFTALIIGIFMAIVFVFITEPRKKHKPVYEFRTDDTGLSVMIQVKRNG